MLIYVMLASLTEEGRRTAADDPEQIEAVTRGIEQIGARVLSNYGRMSCYDIVKVIEVPDGQTIDQIEKLLKIPDLLLTTRFMGPYPSARNGPVDVQQMANT